MISYVCSPAQPATSADEPIGPIQHLWCDREAQSFRHLQVDDELDLCAHFYRDLSWFRPLEDLVHQARHLPTRGSRIRTVAGEAALLDVKRDVKHGRDALLHTGLQDEPRNIPG